jgi:PD-(D/E)XK nuclease superfamily protein
LERWGPRIEPIVEDLLSGGGVERVLDENVVLDEILVRDDALWSLLVFAGYLRAEERPRGRGEQSAHLGLLTTLEPDYEVRSNRESGKGRPDVLVRPKKTGRPGVVLELKVARPGKKTLEQALEEGIAQMRGNDYAAELRAAGAQPIYGFVVAFDGKGVAVRGVELG